jgi:hypothetical protein
VAALESPDFESLFESEEEESDPELESAPFDSEEAPSAPLPAAFFLP